jgi:hypothetical protein
MDESLPARKAHAKEIHEKNWQHFEHLKTAMARTERYEEEAPHKAGEGRTAPSVQRHVVRMYVTMAAAKY